MYFNALSRQTKSLFYLLIKLSIVIGSFYFIYQKLTNSDALRFLDFIAFLKENDRFSIEIIFFLLFLSFFNWFFEILKWKKLVSIKQPISYKTALKQVLGAFTASLITPNRIGDYPAKALYYKPDLRKYIIGVNAIGNLLQLGVTIVFGSVGLALFLTKYNVELNSLRFMKGLFIVLIILGFSIFGLRTKKSWLLIKIKSFIQTLPKLLLLNIFFLSLLRYFIFSFQFYILLYLFNVNLTYYDAMVIITSLYLISSLIPVLYIFDVVIKGSIALFLFSVIDVNEVTILSVVTLMWLLNFVIPGLVGSFFVLRFKPTPK